MNKEHWGLNKLHYCLIKNALDGMKHSWEQGWTILPISSKTVMVPESMAVMNSNPLWPLSSTRDSLYFVPDKHKIIKKEEKKVSYCFLCSLIQSWILKK